MAISPLQIGAPKQIAATANVMPRAGALLGIFCSSSTAGTAAVYDSATTTTSNKVVDTFTLVAGTYYQLPFGVADGIYVVLGGTTAVTVNTA